MEPAGRHLIADLYGCAELTTDEWRAAVTEAVRAMGATLVTLSIHPFSPRGLTGVAVLAESHLSFHTWPEREYVAMDVYTCGTTADPAAGLAVLTDALAPSRAEVREIARGIGLDAEVRS